MTAPVEDRLLGPRLRRAGVLSWALIGILVLCAAVLRFAVYPIRAVFPPLALAVVVVYLLNPLVNALVVRGRRRVWATLIVFLLFVGALVAILVNVVPIVSHQVSDLLDHMPGFLDRAASAINRFAARNHSSFRVHANQQALLSYLDSHRATVIGFVGRARSLGESVLRVIVTFLLAAVLSFYMLVDLPKIKAGIEELVPPPRREEVIALARDVGGALGGFFRGQMLAALFVGVAAALGLRSIGLPFAVLIAVVVGVFNLVPLIGPVIGAVPAVFIGLVSGDANKAWQAALVLLLIEQIDAHVVSPRLVHRTVRLHPITVIVALFAGGALAGIAGIVLVVPSVAVAKILVQYAWEHRGRVIAPAG